jgi:threonyl-tRNA synthetase
MINVTLKDGSVRQTASGTSIFDLAASLSQGLARAAVAGKVNGELKDLSFKLQKDAQVEILTLDNAEGLEVMRHSTSHLLAQAVKNLFPGTILGIGPAIANGFYYDFDSEHIFTPEDLEKIENEMKRLAKEDFKFECREISRPEAIDYFQKQGEKYKVELVNDLPGEARISMYTQGGFTDLCAGPHVPSTKFLKAFKLQSVAGAYWRGSEKNKMLQRIYGLAFAKASDLEDYLFKLEEAKRRDHRKLGLELDLVQPA